MPEIKTCMYELETEGYVVIERGRAGCPDLIAVPREFVQYIKLVTVKGRDPNLTPDQAKHTADLKSKGFQVITEHRPPIITQAEKDRRKWWRSLNYREKFDMKKQWFDDGAQAYHDGVDYSEYPRDCSLGTPIYLAHAAEWRDGWSFAMRRERAHK